MNGNIKYDSGKKKRKEKKITFSKNANPTNLKREYTNQSKNIKYKI